MVQDQVKLAALINANSSGYNDGKLKGLSKKINVLSEQLEGRKRAQELGLCRTTHDEYSINSGIEAIVRFDPEYLVLATGDGGLLTYLGKLKTPYERKNLPLPKIIYLPAGRENRLGYELNYQDLSPTKKALRLLGFPESGYFKKPFTLLEEIGEDLLKDRVNYIPLSLIEAKLDRQRAILTFDVGFGLATNLVLNYYGIGTNHLDKDDLFQNLDHPRQKWDGLKTFSEALFYSMIYTGSAPHRYLENMIDSLAKKIGLEEVANGQIIKEVSPDRLTKVLTALFHLLTYWERRADNYFQKIELGIKTDNKYYGKASWLGGFISTNTHIWKDFQPLYRAREDPKKMHFIGVGGSMIPAALALRLPALYRGGPLGNGTADELTSHLEIKSEKPLVLQMAAEFYLARQAELKIYPQEINFVVPQKRERKKLLGLF